MSLPAEIRSVRMQRPSKDAKNNQSSFHAARNPFVEIAPQLAWRHKPRNSRERIHSTCVHQIAQPDLELRPLKRIERFRASQRKPAPALTRSTGAGRNITP